MIFIFQQTQDVNPMSNIGPQSTNITREYKIEYDTKFK